MADNITYPRYHISIIPTAARGKEPSPIDIIEHLTGWFVAQGLSAGVAGIAANTMAALVIILFVSLADILTKKIILPLLTRYISRNRFRWDDALLERKVLIRLSLFTPAIVIFIFSGIFPGHHRLLQRLSLSYMVLIGIYVMDAFLDAVEDIYKTFEIAKHKPITSLMQVLKIAVYVLGGIWFISTLIDRSPLLLLSGIGALTAVFLVVFKDSLLGLVGGIQLAANDMVRIGDWIEMPKYGADGDVIDISLNTVKVRNWDKTITTIPTYALISDSFKNWRGIQQFGGRRIKRAVYIDTTSIKFCTPEMKERFRKFQHISAYMDRKEKELEEYNREHNVDPTELVNGRRLTNIGTFRAYLQEYIKRHPGIRKDMVILVRQLAPGPSGLPLEIYCFTNTTVWGEYEAIQADIFDHIFAVIPHFDLRVHQNPTGYDLRSLSTLG